MNVFVFHKYYFTARECVFCGICISILSNDNKFNYLETMVLWEMKAEHEVFEGSDGISQVLIIGNVLYLLETRYR